MIHTKYMPVWFPFYFMNYHGPPFCGVKTFVLQNGRPCKFTIAKRICVDHLDLYNQNRSIQGTVSL